MKPVASSTVVAMPTYDRSSGDARYTPITGDSIAKREGWGFSNSPLDRVPWGWLADPRRDQGSLNGTFEIPDVDPIEVDPEDDPLSDLGVSLGAGEPFYGGMETRRRRSELRAEGVAA